MNKEHFSAEGHSDSFPSKIDQLPREVRVNLRIGYINASPELAAISKRPTVEKLDIVV